MSEVERVTAWAETSVGRVRDHNEDAYLVSDELRLYAVADGMGGHAAGEVASRLALDTVESVVREGRDRIAQLRAAPSSKLKAQDVQRLLEEAVTAACAAVHAAGESEHGKRGMGTTLSVLLTTPTLALIAHVGDSRIYLVRGDKAYQLTEDHTLQNELLKRGKLTAEQVAQVKQKNALIRAVGVYESVQVDTLRVEIAAGDCFVLCSDGLHAYLKREELSPLLASDADRAAAQLVALANQRGGHDNITAVVVATAAGELPGENTLARLKLDTLRVATLFRFLSYQELVKIASVTDLRSYHAGQPIFEEGSEGDELFVVLSGKVQVAKGETAIVELAGGQHFGEMALIDRSPRSATVTAAEPTRLLVISRRDFLGLVKQDRDLGVKLLWQFVGVLSSRLRDTSRELNEARGRLAHEALMVFDVEDHDGEPPP